MGSRPTWTDLYKNWRVEGARPWRNIILSNLGFNIFRGFRSTGGQNLHCPIDFAGHIYNSAAATAQPVHDNGVHYLSHDCYRIAWDRL